MSRCFTHLCSLLYFVFQLTKWRLVKWRTWRLYTACNCMLFIYLLKIIVVVENEPETERCLPWFLSLAERQFFVISEGTRPTCFPYKRLHDPPYFSAKYLIIRSSPYITRFHKNHPSLCSKYLWYSPSRRVHSPSSWSGPCGWLGHGIR